MARSSGTPGLPHFIYRDFQNFNICMVSKLSQAFGTFSLYGFKNMYSKCRVPEGLFRSVENSRSIGRKISIFGGSFVWRVPDRQCRSCWNEKKHTQHAGRNWSSEVKTGIRSELSFENRRRKNICTVLLDCWMDHYFDYWLLEQTQRFSWFEPFRSIHASVFGSKLCIFSSTVFLFYCQQVHPSCFDCDLKAIKLVKFDWI